VNALGRHAAAGLAAAALCLGAGAAPALADSIAYVKDGDVWLATPDGARRQQVTHRGSTPTSPSPTTA
jgi:hypothetical protein